MPHPINRLKMRLATIPEDSLRYKYVNGVWNGWEDKGENKTDRIAQAKACTFYWVMIPTSTLGYIAGAIGIALLVLVVFPIGWFFGYHPTPTSEQTLAKLPEYIDQNKLFLPRGFSARTGKKRKHNPWFYMAPMVVIAGLIYLLNSSVLSTAGSATWSFIGSIAPIVGMVLVAGSLLFLIGWILYKNGYRLRRFWDRACPPLVVVKDD